MGGDLRNFSKISDGGLMCIAHELVGYSLAWVGYATAEILERIQGKIVLERILRQPTIGGGLGWVVVRSETTL